MSRVKQRDTKPEILVRQILHKLGYRFRLHRKDLPGTPDIYLPKFRSVIFVHGCFWHGHTCKRGKLPETRRDFWENKITRNRERDILTLNRLEEMGLNSVVVWECELKDKNALSHRLTAALSDHRIQ